MNPSNFYTELDLKYPEIAICLEDSDNGVGKFFIPILTPLHKKNKAYDNKDNPISTRNILSDTINLELSQCTVSNYIELKIPGERTVKKGQEFIIVFVGGDMNKPRIIGGY